MQNNNSFENKKKVVKGWNAHIDSLFGTFTELLRGHKFGCKEVHHFGQRSKKSPKITTLCQKINFLKKETE